MRTSSIVTTAVGVMFAVAMAGCVPLPDNTAEPTPNQTPRSTATAAGGDCEPHAAPTATNSMEGAYGYAEMGDYVNVVVDELITPWLHCTWKQMPEPREVVYVPHGAQGFENCLDSSGDAGLYTSESYEYCPADRNVYVGQDMLWLLYSRTGDAGPAVGLAHEFGHHVQQMVGVPSPRTAQESIEHENQADCIAGAWVQFTDKILKALEPEDDLQDIDTLMPLIGSAEGPDRDHGTTAERVEAFNLGYQRGISACNEFFPNTPLVTS